MNNHTETNESKTLPTKDAMSLASVFRVPQSSRSLKKKPSRGMLVEFARQLRGR